MSFYHDIFDLRGQSYNIAMERFPDAREVERSILLDLLVAQPGEKIIDAPAGGGYLADELARLGATPVCIEPSENFAQPLSGRFETYLSDIYNMPPLLCPVDKVGSLAGLHHLDHDQVQAFFDCSYRALKAGGVIAVADVLEGSPVAEFLNGPVDKWSETGHEGMFYKAHDFTGYLKRAGFRNITEKHEDFLWQFDCFDDLVTCCQLLFGLVKAEKVEIASTLVEMLGVTECERGVGLKWSLLYAKGEK
ncbi:MAG: class I SAM-dependent methyltransferase [Alcanivorax sp.]|nr:class I SAM-dependent methyltransferase [Alcanivorax sp.]